MGAVFLLGLLGTPLALLGPVPLKIIVDNVIGSQPLPAALEALLPEFVTASDSGILVVALTLLISVTFLGLLVSLGGWVLKDYAGEKIILEFRSRLFEQVQRLSLAHHDSQGEADYTYRIQWDAPAIRWLPIDGLIPLSTAVVTFVAMIVVTALISFDLAVIALLISPILLVLNRMYSRQLKDQWREVKQSESSALAVVQEVLGVMRVVKAFGQERRERKRFEAASAPYFRQRLRVILFESSFSFLTGLTTGLGTAAVLFVGVRAVLRGELTLGNLLLVMAYLGQLYAPLQTIGKQIAAQQGALVSAERAFSILDTPHEIQDRVGAKSLAQEPRTIDFCRVSFSYLTNQPVLQDVSFRVPPGTRVGIAGRTGSGKTTLMSLLIRFYDPDEGQILLNDVDYREYRLVDLRNQFSIVLQEPVLFATTIAENIKYGVADATDADIVQASQAANAHDFIKRCPDGYDALVGERGMRLSGGERQRIALARAFLKDAPILILDEPTSSVDVNTEAAIMDAMERLMQGRTTFIIAHRLTTLKNCDVCFNMDEGRLVELPSDQVWMSDSRRHGTAAGRAAALLDKADQPDAG